ncbi:redox-sensitive transcriptional activator SoxR [Blastomonas sp.]|uniref:redox-sensitive transcriptional activator SoxR n=1 Tax=Blastomonas sp. TaxID=1909299 RepID=UPI003593AC17
MALPKLLSIGDLARRTGLSVSAIRFYETRGLVQPMRNSAGQRRFVRSDIRRLSFVLIAQQIGLTLEEIVSELARLPEGRVPDARDWEAISLRFRARLDAQIEALAQIRDRLDGCIGCGCLSLERCAIYNPDDRAAAFGPGPQFIWDGAGKPLKPARSPPP